MIIHVPTPALFIFMTLEDSGRDRMLERQNRKPYAHRNNTPIFRQQLRTYPAKAKRARLNKGFRGEHTLSASLSGTSKSSLPFGDDRLLFAGVTGGGELAATTTSASMAVQAESARSASSSAGGGVPGKIGSAGVSGSDAEPGLRGGGSGCHASVCRLSKRALAGRGMDDEGTGGAL